MVRIHSYQPFIVTALHSHLAIVHPCIPWLTLVYPDFTQVYREFSILVGRKNPVGPFGMSKFPLQDRIFTEFIQKHFIHRYLGVIVCEMLTLLQCPWSSHRVVHMSNWMNYRPNSILRFWSYKQMTHLTRNPPISIRLAEKSKFRKWNVHNVTHHNGSDDQNIAGKYSIDN